MRFFTQLFVAAMLTLAIPVDPAFAQKSDKYDRPYDPYFERPQVWSPDLSPDGRYVAFAQRQDDEHFVLIKDLFDADAPPKGIKIGDKANVNWVRWGNDDRVIYSATRLREIRGETFGTAAALYGINKDGTGNKQYFSKNKQFQESRFITALASDLPNEKESVLVPVSLDGDLDLVELNVNTGKFKVKERAPKNLRAWFIDINGDPAFYLALEDRGQKAKYYARNKDGSGEKWRLAATVRRDPTSNTTVDDFRPIGPGPDPATYYVIARPNGANYAGVHLYNFETNTYVQEMFTPDGADVAAAFIDARDGTFEGGLFRRGRMEMAMMDDNVAVHMNALDGYFGKEVVLQPVGRSEDKKTYLFRTEGPGDPGSYHYYNTDKRQVIEIGVAFENLLNTSLASGRVVEYTARDGLQLFGYLTQPPGMKPGDKPPLIMMPHGGPEARTEFGYSFINQLLAQAGYQVFEPNFRGSTGRGSEFADMGRRQWGKAMQNDVDDALAHLAKAGIADENRACIMGFSYGGYAALAAATLTPEKYRCIVAGAAPADLIEMLESEKREGAFGYNYWTRHIGHKDKNRDEIIAVSPAHQVNNVVRPILLHHGTTDTIVPYQQGIIMRDALKKAGKDVTWVAMQQIGHSYPFRKGETRNEYFDTLFAFLDKHLPADK